MTEAAADFYFWIDQAPMNGVIPFPPARAKKHIERQAVGGTPPGRIVLWMWREKGLKLVLAMARIGGDGGDRAIFTVRDKPPFNDADKAQFVYQKERG